MDQEHILKRYGQEVCRIRLSNSGTRSKAYLYAEECDYPVIAMGYIGQKLFSQENIDHVHNTDEPCTVKVLRKDLRDILYGLDKTIIKTNEQANIFIEGLLENKYPAVNGLDIAFKKTDNCSKLYMCLMKSA